MKSLVTVALCTLFLSFHPAVSRADDNWPGWRGPRHNGVSPAQSAPLEWSSTKNVVWKAELPGGSGSTPVVWNDRIFLTCGGGGKNLLLAFDSDGKKLWQVTLGDERPGKNRRGTGSNPSPATDGERVFAYYKSGDLAAVDVSGKVVWQKNLQDLYGEDTLWWDLGTSPILTDDHVIVACMHSGPSYLAAFDKKTGEEAWKQDRNLGAPSEAAQSYSTPVLIEHEGKQKIIVLGADHVTAHDAKTGKELWRVGGLNPTGDKFFRSISGPVVADERVLAPYARGTTLTSIRLGGSGDVTESHVEWTSDAGSADVPTPAAIDGRVYVCHDEGEVACIDIESGKELWRERFERSRFEFNASPVICDGKVYFTREDGTTFVVEHADSFKLLATNTLGETTRATPVFVNGRVYIKTYEHLYCIGEK